MAQRFNAGSLQLVGEAFPVAEGVRTNSVTPVFTPVSASENGTLLYWGGASGNSDGPSQMVWYDRAGKLLDPVSAPGRVQSISLSPDEKSAAFSRITGATADVWLIDLLRGTDRRFTSDPSQNLMANWSPKGDRIVFRSNRAGHPGDLFLKRVNGSEPEELLLSTPNSKTVTQWSRDGRFIVYYELDPKTQRDIWVLPVSDDVGRIKPQPLLFLQTTSNELQGQLSPDNHWMAYTSDDSGEQEVWVRPFPPSDGLWRISTAGGAMPRWSADGKELFYVAGDGKMTAVQIIRASAGPGAKSSFEFGPPVALFDMHSQRPARGFNIMTYDVTADGKRFLVNAGATVSLSSAAPPLTVVMNWMR
jgi:Tol biopolymer transport system component